MNTEPELIHRQRTILADLLELADRRSREEQRIAREFAARNADAERDYREGRERNQASYTADTAATELEYAEVRCQANAEFDTDYLPLQDEYDQVCNRIAEQLEAEQEQAQREYDETRWLNGTVFEGHQKGTQAALHDFQQQVTTSMESLRGTWAEACQVLRDYKHGDLEHSAALLSPEPMQDDSLAQLQTCDALSQTQLAKLKTLRVARLFQGWTLVWPFCLMWAVVCAPAVALYPWYLAVPLVSVGSVLIAMIVRVILYAIARRQTIREFQPLAQALVTAEAVRQRGLDAAAERYRRQRIEIEQQHERDLKQAEAKHKLAVTIAEQRHDADLLAASAKYSPRLDEFRRRRDEVLRNADEVYPRRLREIRDRFDLLAGQIEEQYPTRLAASRRQREEEWAEMAHNWRHGLDAVQSMVDDIDHEVDLLFPAWDDPRWRNWQSPGLVPPVLRVGQFEVDLQQIPGGIPADELLKKSVPSPFQMPALLPFNQQRSLLLGIGGSGRDAAVNALQVAMLRLLTTLPPGKVRFTIIDPVGLGQNFAAFMHLADHDEALVNSRIWTEPSHIDQRLSDLTAHMENVIQKYLRNEFQTIEEYNEHAGEVAEPFRILVVANFPFNFTETAARRLVSIAASGARCGVHTLISVDPKQPLPPSFDLRDLAAHSVNLHWENGEFHFPGGVFEGHPLSLDQPPEAEFFRDVLHQVGKQAKEASRVEVPFEFIAPSAAELWSQDSRGGLSVPLGRAGVTKRQHLSLGKGTSQHVLVSGKTGSGKSTLLHALITNLALRYSPDEVELYLVDFKKGVEFKTYATHELPHASVVAIESEREFGLSVLERLDAELKHRAELFRELGVQDLSGYREQSATAPRNLEASQRETAACRAMPRILLIVDEFQELFVEDDKLAQDAALLFDRLVRQGRAFGIHVLLGSQTLGGAYTLARSTIGQMAVRIALQCSETDAHLILSEDNSAARLLSRPGEAIYNDSNGLVEGNHPFQVVWLSDDKREEYLRQIQQLARRRGHDRSQPQIVFEGNAPADIRKNHLLSRLVDTPCKSSRGSAAAWLGESVAIKDPTAAVLLPQGGSNLLIVGQQEPAALGMMTTGLISLAAHHPADGAGFYVFDGSPVDSPSHGMLGRLAHVLPHPFAEVGRRELVTVINDLAEEVERRQASGRSDDGLIYLAVFDLARFRDLRKAEDDYGFGREGERPSPAKQFVTILREGPHVGVHTLVWCDTLNNLNRTFDRQALREFELLAMFQMSPTDSSHLIDTPAASKLGPNRALLYNQDQAKLEKFRPYAVPSEAWLVEIQQRLAERRGFEVEA